MATEEKGTVQESHSFTIVPDALTEDETISGDAKLIYLIINTHTIKTRPTAWPGRQRLMKLAGFKKYRLDQAINELESTGWIAVNRQKGKPNNYTVQKTSPTTRLHQSGDQTTTSPVTRPEAEQIKHNKEACTAADEQEMQEILSVCETRGFDTDLIQDQVRAALANGIKPDDFDDFIQFLINTKPDKPIGYIRAMLGDEKRAAAFLDSNKPTGPPIGKIHRCRFIDPITGEALQNSEVNNEKAMV